MTQVSLIEFYAAKLESYMRRKHDNILKADESSSNDLTSPPPRSFDEESKSPTVTTDVSDRDHLLDKLESSTEKLVATEESPRLEN